MRSCLVGNQGHTQSHTRTCIGCRVLGFESTAALAVTTDLHKHTAQVVAHSGHRGKLRAWQPTWAPCGGSTQGWPHTLLAWHCCRPSCHSASHSRRTRSSYSKLAGPRASAAYARSAACRSVGLRKRRMMNIGLRGTKQHILACRPLIRSPSTFSCWEGPGLYPSP